MLTTSRPSAPPAPLPVDQAPDVTAEWLEAACLGGMLPPEVKALLDAAAAAYGQDEVAEAHLRRAVALAPEHPAVHIGLYRFYFYKNRLDEALGVGLACLAKAARDNGLPADWREVRLEQADFSNFAAVLPRFYLFTLKGCAYLSMRLGQLETGEAMVDKLTELDPSDRLGGSVLRGVLSRLGVDDDD
jgi:tetratricopeptide (TPR) repeat protein